MNRIYRRGIKNRKIQKSVGRNASSTDTLHTQYTLNGFNIIELNEEEINSDLISDLPNIKEREITRIKKKAQAIEGYYLGKGEDAKISENCFNCLMTDFQANELLYFAKRKDLLIYLRYCFYFLKKIIFTDNQVYIDNKYDLDKCDTNYLNGWKFFIPKTMCRGCFLQMINMEHLFGNLKTIFSDVDATTLRKNFRRNRSHFNPRIRAGNSVQKNENTIGENYRRRGIGHSQRRKNFRYKMKNNKNIAYDDKNGLILLKKNILSEDVVENLKENEKKNKFLGKKKHPEGNITGEQLVTEIKIKTNEFITVSMKLKEKNNENNVNKNNKEIKNDVTEKTGENNNMNNNADIQNKKDSINMKNTPLINNTNINNSNKIQGENNNQMKMNEINTVKIYQDIMKMKGINNKIVMKLHYKLEVLFYFMYMILVDIIDFIDKLNNTFSYNPFFLAQLLSSTLSLYEDNYQRFYNQLFTFRKEFEEIFKKIKNDSIPIIAKNIAKLKGQPNLKEEEIKTLEEMEKTLKEYSNQMAELEKKYNDQIKIYFNHFNNFLGLIGKIKENHS